MPNNFNINPTPLQGRGAFGLVPGTIGLPNPAGDLAGQIPGLNQLNQSAASTIQAKLGGSISPATQRALQDAAATYGNMMGMAGGIRPNSLAFNKLFGNIAGFAENQAAQGLQEYNQFVPTVSGTQTVSPQLQTAIAGQNALSLAAPSPADAQSHAEQLFQKYLNALRGPGGGAGGMSLGGMGGGPGRDLLGFQTGGTGTGAGGGMFGPYGATGTGPILAGAGGVLPGATPYNPDLAGGIPYSAEGDAFGSEFPSLEGGGGGGFNFDLGGVPQGWQTGEPLPDYTGANFPDELFGG